MAEPTPETLLESVLIHDANNKLAPILGYSSLLLTDPALEKLTPLERIAFRRDLQEIVTSAQALSVIIEKLRGVYTAKDQGVQPIEASQLGQREVKYTIVHIDDEVQQRDLFYKALTVGSNVIPVLPGLFGHDDGNPDKIRVSYEVQSYASVEKALRGLNGLKNVDLIVTDREMQVADGYALLNALTKENRLKDRVFRRLPKRSLDPQYGNVRKLAMLTGGIQPDEASRIKKTYGIPVLVKPLMPLQLEQRVYEIVR